MNQIAENNVSCLAMGSALDRTWGARNPIGASGVMKAKEDASAEYVKDASGECVKDASGEFVNTDMLDPLSVYFGLLLHAVLFCQTDRHTHVHSNTLV
jgi:hypothetical protein